MSPNTLPFRRRIVSAAESSEFSRAPIASRLVPPPIVAGPTREDQHDKALSDARVEGYVQGRADAAAEPMLEIERQRVVALETFLTSVTTAAEGFAADRRRIVEEMTQEVADLGYAVVESLLGANLTGGDELVDSLRRSLELVPSNQAITIRLNPAAEIAPETISAMVETDAVSIVADASVEVNGCVIEAGPTRIDGQISTAIRRIERVFDTLRHDGDVAR